MNIKHASSTENESGHELISVFVFSDGKRIKSTFELNDKCGNYVELTLIFMERRYKSQAATFFRALNKIRANLEMDNKYLICYGTCEDVYPSGMSVSTGTGRLAYRCKPGMPALSTDIVDIFDADDYCVPATIQAQMRFNEKWLKSISEKNVSKKIRIGPKFRNACFIVCALLWGCAIAYYFLKGDDTSGAIMFFVIVLGCVVFFVPALPFFKFVNKADSKPQKSITAISVEKQLSVLSELGIKPKQEDFKKWVCDEWGIEDIESDPYNSLLYVLGGKRQFKYGTLRWAPLSDDIYTFYADCVVNDDIYTVALKCLAALSKGVLDISNVLSKVDHDDNNVAVSFSISGENHSWQLRNDGDLFDILFISKINSLLKNMGLEKLFYLSIPAQGLHVVFCKEEVISTLNSLISTPFFLDVSEYGGTQYLSYSLRTNNDAYSSNLLCAGLFDSILSTSDPDDFMVLAPDEPINRSTFLQTANISSSNTEFSYALEVAFGRKNRSSAMYRLNTNDKDIVLQHFVDYWRDQKLPDVSLWEDVSKEMR